MASVDFFMRTFKQAHHHSASRLQQNTSVGLIKGLACLKFSLRLSQSDPGFSYPEQASSTAQGMRVSSTPKKVSTLERSADWEQGLNKVWFWT